MNNRNIITTSQINQPLGNGLEARLRTVKGLERFTFFAGSSEGSPITTTYRTLGMPASSVVNTASFLDGALLLGIASTSANDTVAGTGARKITIYGLDNNWNPISELINMNGQTKVVSTKQFLRINQLVVEETGTLGYNAGDIFVSISLDTFTAGVPQTIVLSAMLASTATILKNISTFGIYSFKAGYKGVLSHGNFYTDASSSKTLTFQEYNISPSTLGNRINYTSGPLNLSGNISYDFTGSGTYGEKNDYQLLVKCSNATSNGTVYYNGFLVDLKEKNF